MNKPSTSSPALTVVAQALSPKSEALQWLSAAQRAGTSFKVPIEVRRSALGISGAELGFADDRISVEIDETALGIALADRAATWCGDDADKCAMWVWARWKDGTLVITKAEAKIPPSDRASATHIHVAK